MLLSILKAAQRERTKKFFVLSQKPAANLEDSVKGQNKKRFFVLRQRPVIDSEGSVTEKQKHFLCFAQRGWGYFAQVTAADPKGVKVSVKPFQRLVVSKGNAFGRPKGETCTARPPTGETCTARRPEGRRPPKGQQPQRPEAEGAGKIFHCRSKNAPKAPRIKGGGRDSFRKPV